MIPNPEPDFSQPNCLRVLGVSRTALVGLYTNRGRRVRQTVGDRLSLHGLGAGPYFLRVQAPGCATTHVLRVHVPVGVSPLFAEASRS